jgi:predicted dehydrogenase
MKTKQTVRNCHAKERKMAKFNKLNRRQFLRSTMAAGASVVFAKNTLAMQSSQKPTDELNIALIGAGEQGKNLAEACLKMGSKANLRFKALCDIWPYNRDKLLKRLNAYDHQPNTYTDYKEMLDAEKDLDVAIIATPDFCHAEQTISCLNKGLHVYCETEMAATIEDAKKMARAAKQSGKLLQIGRQLRSNPLYIHCADKLIKDAKILGTITSAAAQTNESIQTDLGAPKKYALEQQILEKYGYESMHQFRNWRWYKKLGSGPAVDNGAHQLDVINWLLGTTPKSIMAAGSTNFYDKQTHQWYDNVMAILEYNLENRIVSAAYQLSTTNSSQGRFEKFMGTEATLILSEQSEKNAIYREQWLAQEKWDQWVEKGYLTKTEPQTHGGDEETDQVRPSVAVAAFGFPPSSDVLSHQLHLENFFEAVRGKTALNCPADIALKSAVTTLKINEAIEAGTKVAYKPDEFKI